MKKGESISEKAMNNYKRFAFNFVLGIALTCGILFSGCDNLPIGNNFLSSPPTLGYNQDSVFSSKKNVKQLLVNLYATLPWPLSHYTDPQHWVRNVGMGRLGTMVNMTDIAFASVGFMPVDRAWYPGTYTATSPGEWAPFFFARPELWKSFYEGWTLINNIHRVPNMNAAEKKRFKAEAKTIMAYHFVNMFRYMGGIVWIGKAYNGNSKIPEHPRLTAMASVDSIAALLNYAIKYLPLNVPTNQLGRVTKASAAALKTRLLNFAASPLLNSPKPYLSGEAAAKKLVWMGGYKPKLWKRAATAAKQCIKFIQQCSYYGLVEPVTRGSAGFRKAYRKGYLERGSGETLFSSRFGSNPPAPFTSQTNGLGWSWAIVNAPTQTYAEMFPDKNGIPIKESPIFNPKHPYWNRDPRFYETLTSNEEEYRGQPAQLWIGGKLRPIQNQGQASGGYMVRKFDVKTLNSPYPLQFPLIRIPEVYFDYAEALNEVNAGPTGLAFKYVNKVRHRVGLENIQKIMKDPTSEKEFNKLILRGRALEFGFENVRWFDMVRRKRVDIFQKDLKGLDIYKNPDGSFTHKTFDIGKRFTPRHWVKKFTPRIYFEPFPESEIAKDYGLIQNPGWEIK